MKLAPLFTAENGGRIAYCGSRLFEPVANIRDLALPPSAFQSAASIEAAHERLDCLAAIDDQIFRSTVAYFGALGTRWANVPLTTKMISSPGAVWCAGIHEPSPKR